MNKKKNRREEETMGYDKVDLNNSLDNDKFFS